MERQPDQLPNFGLRRVLPSIKQCRKLHVVRVVPLLELEMWEVSVPSQILFHVSYSSGRERHCMLTSILGPSELPRSRTTTNSPYREREGLPRLDISEWCPADLFRMKGQSGSKGGNRLESRPCYRALGVNVSTPVKLVTLPALQSKEDLTGSSRHRGSLH